MSHDLVNKKFSSKMIAIVFTIIIALCNIIQNIKYNKFMLILIYFYHIVCSRSIMYSCHCHEYTCGKKLLFFATVAKISFMLQALGFYGHNRYLLFLGVALHPLIWYQLKIDSHLNQMIWLMLFEYVIGAMFEYAGCNVVLILSTFLAAHIIVSIIFIYHRTLFQICQGYHKKLSLLFAMNVAATLFTMKSAYSEKMFYTLLWLVLVFLINVDVYVYVPLVLEVLFLLFSPFKHWTVFVYYCIVLFTFS